MVTLKKRINVSLPKHIEKSLKFLSLRDEIPEATKAAQLIELAIEIDEDEIFDSIVKKRDTKNAKFISHKDAWK